MASWGGSKNQSDRSQALTSSLTDLMTSLAVIFILLLVVFLKQANDQSRRAKEQIENQLAEILKEKSLNLAQDPDDPLKLAVRVGEDVLRFSLGSAALSTGGVQFVDSFFLKFSEQLCAPKTREQIDSITVEGHTDRSGERTPEGVKFNIALSQKRSYSVLEQALKSVQGKPELYECLLKLASASGRGSRSPVFEGTEYNADRSRRVEIKIRVKSAEQTVRKLLEDH